MYAGLEIQYLFLPLIHTFAFLDKFRLKQKIRKQNFGFCYECLRCVNVSNKFDSVTVGDQLS